MDLRCPQCNSTDLKKLSLAYQEGISHVNAGTRLRDAMVGSDGPDLVVGSWTTKGIQQTAISKVAAPPTTWSYKTLVGWSVVVSCGGLDCLLYEYCHDEFRKHPIGSVDALYGRCARHFCGSRHMFLEA